MDTNMTTLKRGVWTYTGLTRSKEFPSGKVRLCQIRCSLCGADKYVRKNQFIKGAYVRCECQHLPRPTPGDQVYEWTVTGSERRNGREYFNTVCSCGNIGLVYGSDLLSGRSKRCVNCGHANAVLQGEALRDSCVKKIFRTYKRNAESRGHEFSLTEDDVRNLIFQPCAYSRHDPMSVARTYPGSPHHILYNGLDRKDNDAGYTIANTVTCCSVCNRAKRAMPYDQWMDWLDGFGGVNNA